MGKMGENIRLTRTVNGVNFEELAKLLSASNLADFDAKTRKRAFIGSTYVCFLYDGNKLIGCARAISDGAYEAALYDVAVAPEYRGKGLGRLLVETILADLEGQNVIFFSSLPAQPFYESLGCLRMNTGMAYWRNPERMRERGYSD
jgi:ribosomal protein S18 acetylase RimI-like enzyme